MDRICTLEQALEQVEPCGESECSFWLTDKGSERCVLEGVERELLARPPVASYLLALRRRLDEAGERSSSPERTTHGH